MDTSTVLLRLEGPVQGWGGAGSRWDFRSTENRPTKSAIIGLTANALGRTYTTPIDDLAALHFGVRADRPGHIEFDYRTAGGGTFPLDTHTLQHAETTTGKTNPIDTNTLGRTTRYGAPRGSHDWSEKGRGIVLRHQTLLVDAAFLVALTGPTPLTTQIAEALASPARLLSLGRRANPPAHDVGYNLLHGDRHHTWFNETPLLPSATETQPSTWIEQFSTDAAISYEQPTTTQRRGGEKQGLPLTCLRAEPPAPQEHAA